MTMNQSSQNRNGQNQQTKQKITADRNSQRDPRNMLKLLKSNRIYTNPNAKQTKNQHTERKTKDLKLSVQ